MNFPQIDFSPLADLPKVYQQAQMQRSRQATLADLGRGLSNEEAAARLIAAGDPMGLQLSHLANNQRDFQFRQDESRRAQGNTDRQFKLQEDQATAAARGFEYREVDDGNGGKILVRINKQTGQGERVNIPGQDGPPQNPYMTGGAMNEAQSKDALYASRAMQSERVLRGTNPDAAVAETGLPGGGIMQGGNVVPGPGAYGVENTGTSTTQRALGVIGDKVGYNLRGPEHQQFDQAKRDFINSILRRESGAVISPSEFDNANKQYFPMPGDTPQVIEQKRRNRTEAIKGIGAGAGRGYRPDHAFDQNGQIVVNASPRRGQPQQQSLPRVNSPADAAKLPKGTRFLDPNGVERVVP